MSRPLDIDISDSPKRRFALLKTGGASIERAPNAIREELERAASIISVQPEAGARALNVVLSGHMGDSSTRAVPSGRGGGGCITDRPGAPGNYQTVEDAATFVGVWSIDNDGDVPPRYTIGHRTFKEFLNFAVNGKNKEVMMSDKTQNSIFTFTFPEAWETFTPLTAAQYTVPGGRGRFGGGGGGGR